jgi:hypothetical protein
MDEEYRLSAEDRMRLGGGLTPVLVKHLSEARKLPSMER